MSNRTHKRIWFDSESDFSWLSSAGHMIPEGCYWDASSVLATIDTDCPWSELRAIIRLVGVRPRTIQTSRQPLDQEAS